MASLICQRSAGLTPAIRSAPQFFAKAPQATFSTTTRQPPASLSEPKRPQSPPLPTAPKPRHASTTSTPTIDPSILTWDRFFDLRRKRRYLNLGSSIVTATTSIAVFGPVIASQDIDGWAAQVSGLDPFIVLGLTTFAVATGGWLCGPSIGNMCFRVWAARRGWRGEIGQKEKSLYSRIKRYRADPAASSPQNPLPDYYGEKIASVKDYRRWLKDQKAFNRKKERPIV